MPAPRESVYRFDHVVVDVARQMVFVGGAQVDLEPKVFRLLVTLIENRHRVVKKAELFDTIWHAAAVTDNALTRSVAKLRRALGDNARSARFIETIPTVGYRFVAGLAETQPAPADTPASGREPPAALPSKGSRRVLVAALALTALVVAVVAGQRLVGSHSPAKAELLQPRQLTSSTGLEAQPALSPAGSEVVYCSDRTGQMELYVRQLAPGSRDVQITFDSGGCINPAWSRDGHAIAYHNLTHNGIWVIPSLGGTARQLTTFGSMPVWSPDNRWVAFRSASSVSMATGDMMPSTESTIWVVPASGGQPRRVSSTAKVPGKHTTPAWSRDGNSIAFATYLPKRAVTELWSVRVPGGQHARLADASLDCMWPRYLPDGELVAGCEDHGQFTIRKIPGARTNSAGETLVMLGFANPNGISVSDDGRIIAWSTATVTGQLWSAPIAPETGVPKGSARQLTRDTQLRHSLPAISPEGTRVAYWARHREVLSNLTLLSLSSGESQVVASHPSDFYLMSWVWGGNALAYPSYRGNSGTLMSNSLQDRVERKVAPLPPDHELPRLSPDGLEIAFQRESGGVMNVWKADIASGRQTQLTFDHEGAAMGAWSLDGKWISVQLVRGNSTQVGVVPSAGGATLVLTKEPGQAWPFSFLPDNDRVAYSALRAGAWNVYWTARTTGATKRITDFRSLAALVLFPAWSPQGDQVIFEHGVNQGNVYFANLARR